MQRVYTRSLLFFVGAYGSTEGTKTSIYVLFQFPFDHQEIFLHSTASRPALEITQPPTQWVPGALSPGVKQPGREAGHSPMSGAEVKKGGAIPPLLHTSSCPGT
jgi:hypothetical protein